MRKRTDVSLKPHRTAGQQRRSTSDSSVIGGIFGLELLELDVDLAPAEPPSFLSGRRQLLATARSAVKLLVRALRPPNVWVPSYICGVVIEAINEHGVRVRFYPVDESLNIANQDWLAQIRPGDLAIFVDYFGFDNWTTCGAEAKARGACIVEDACQAMLNEHFSPHSDYIFFSPRKFIGVPDGGILIAANNAQLPDSNLLPAPADWFLLALKASIRRAEFDRFGGDRDWSEMFQYTESSGPIEPYRMSDVSAGILQVIDWSEIKKRRRQNYRALLAEIGELAIFRDLPPRVVPLGFPIRVKNRNQVRGSLFADQIYPPVHWDIVDLVPKEFAGSHLLAREVMTLPCDQRYHAEDMRRMVASLKRSLCA
jgi:dTDP-4-amino-4,6-dideoxygalactose transaminase